MKHSFLIALFLICLASLVTFAQAPAAFSISGTVHDATGSVIPGAEVTIAPPTANPTQASPASASTVANGPIITDAQGNFQVTVPAAGAYSVLVTAPGFADYKVQATFAADSPSPTLNIELKINATAETVEVTANHAYRRDDQHPAWRNHRD